MFARFCAVALVAVAALGGLAAAAEPAVSFTDWLAAFRTAAAGAGIAPAVLDSALAGLQPIDRVLELDRRQPEFSLSFADYMRQVVNPARIKRGRQLLRQERRPLQAIARAQGVPAAQIVAMWGIESDYGRLTGSFPVVAALATLAYDGRRSQYFRGELIAALTMLDHGVPPQNLRGSWAGAMGQCQFMPSTYLAYAQAAAGDAPADIWHRPEDVWNSSAHYLKGLGWRGDQPWGMAVRLPRHGVAAALTGLEHARPLQDWRRLGLRRADGHSLKGAGDAMMALIRVDGGRDGSGGSGPAYLVGDNFRALLHWNRSFFFAVAAGTLADRLETP